MTTRFSCRYATTADGVRIAFQTYGDGPVDLLVSWGAWSNIEVVWEYPPARACLERLARFARVIQFDKRGTGLSDRSCALPTYDHQLDDVLAVLDAASARRAAVFAGGEAAHLAILFAATHPARTSAVVLYATHLRFLRDPLLPGGVDEAALDAVLDRLTERWGTGVTAPVIIPTAVDDVSRDWWAKLERHSLSPDSVEPLFRMVAASDVRDVLGAVSVPTLVLHRKGDRYAPIEHGRFTAERIRGARLVELDGVDHAGWVGDWEAMANEVEAFLTGARPQRDTNRVLATVLFTDIVASTEHAVTLGDQQWRERLAHHDAIVATEVEAHRGRLVKSTGDGILATFDAPGRAVACAQRIVNRIPSLGIDLRAGLHTGEIELVGDDVAGVAIHLAARAQAAAAPGTVTVTRTVVDLVAGSGLRFHDLGEHHLKGFPEPIRLYAVDA